MFCSSCKKVWVCFTIVSNIVTTKRIPINKIRANFLMKGILKTTNVWRLYGDWKTILRWQKLKLFCTDLTNLDLNSNEFFPTNVSTHSIFFLSCKSIYHFIYQNIIQKSFNGNVNNVTRVKMSLRLSIYWWKNKNYYGNT